MKNYTDKIKELKEEIAKLEGTQDVLSLLARCTEGHDWSLTNVVGDFGLIGIIQLKCRACETNRTLHVEAKLEIVLDGELVVLINYLSPNLYQRYLLTMIILLNLYLILMQVKVSTRLILLIYSLMHKQGVICNGTD